MVVDGIEIYNLTNPAHQLSYNAIPERMYSKRYIPELWEEAHLSKCPMGVLLFNCELYYHVDSLFDNKPLVFPNQKIN